MEHITINLISLGDVIESLKTNTLLGSLQTQLTPSQVEEQIEKEQSIINSVITTIGDALGNIFESAGENTY